MIRRTITAYMHSPHLQSRYGSQFTYALCCIDLLESIIHLCNKVQEVTIMALSHVILATLLSGPVSGYGLTKRFNRAIGYFWHATHQQIYRELATLEAHGYIERVSSP